MKVWVSCVVDNECKSGRPKLMEVSVFRKRKDALAWRSERMDNARALGYTELSGTTVKEKVHAE